jgi:putative ABC transport system ATP-binding protein
MAGRGLLALAMEQALMEQAEMEHAVDPLRVRALRKALGDRVILDDISLAVGPAERVALIGESGSGKSTLLNLIAGLDRPDSGEILIAGEAMPSSDTDAGADLRRRRLGFVFQAFHLLPHLNLERNVAVPLLLNGVPLGAALERARDLLGRLGLGDRARDLPGQLSGGEQQRIALARALATRPSLLLADEPTGNLDPSTAARALALIMAECETAEAALLLVTHSEVAARSADRCLRLSDGRLVEV